MRCLFFNFLFIYIYKTCIQGNNETFFHSSHFDLSTTGVSDNIYCVTATEGAIVNVIGSTCDFPAFTSQKCLLNLIHLGTINTQGVLMLGRLSRFSLCFYGNELKLHCINKLFLTVFVVYKWGVYTYSKWIMDGWIMVLLNGNTDFSVCWNYPPFKYRLHVFLGAKTIFPCTL